MAFEYQKFASLGVNLNRQKYGPLDIAYVFQNETDFEWYVSKGTQNSATKSAYWDNVVPYPYPGLITAVIIGNDVSVRVVIDEDGNWKEVGSNNSPMLFVAGETEMLNIADDISAGQQVYREDTHTVWIFKGGDKTQLSNWVESASQNDTVWYGTENKVIFYALTQSTYDSLETKDVNTLYFLTDSGKVFKGTVSLTDSVIPVSVIPEVASAVANKLYINTSTLEAKVTIDNANWINLTPGYITDGGNWTETTNDSKLGTIAVVKQIITQALATISTDVAFDNSTGTVTVGEGTGAVLTGVAHDPSYNAEQLKLTIPVYGGTDIVVDIPKDKFVTAGQYYAQYPVEDPTYYNVIVLTIDNQAEPVIIPAEALVNVYTANNTGKDVEITITDDNEISAIVKIDPVAGNALVTSESGLKVDVSGKMDKIESATGTKVALTTAEGGVTESGYTITASGEMGSSDTVVPTANLIASAIATAVNSAVSDKVDKVVGAENNIITFAAEGAIQDSGKAIGGATLNTTPDANTVATEAAVADAISWNTL